MATGTLAWARRVASAGPRAALTASAVARGARLRYLTALAWAFSLFSTLRLLAYLPTLWAIQASGDASQHSLLTWLTWLGANLTMAAWLYEQGGQRLSRAVLVNACNAAMCAAICVLVALVRWGG